MTDKQEPSGDSLSLQSANDKSDAPATPGPLAEGEYPPFKTVLATVLGMMSISLLVALVSPIRVPSHTTALTASRTEL
jgi:hypothetical protein